MVKRPMAPQVCDFVNAMAGEAKALSRYFRRYSGHAFPRKICDYTVHYSYEQIVQATADLRSRTLDVLPGLWWKLWYCARVERREQPGFEPDQSIRSMHSEIVEEIFHTPLRDLLGDAEENGAEALLIPHLTSDALVPDSLVQHSRSHLNALVSNLRALLREKRRREPSIPLRPLLQACNQTNAIGLSVLDPAHRFAGLNLAAAAMLGSAPEEYVGKTTAETMGDVAQVVDEILEEVFHTGRFVSTSVHGRLPKQPGERDWLAKYLPMHGQDHHVDAIAAFVVEVTAQRELEKRLGTMTSRERSNPDVERWLNSMRDSLIVFDIFVDRSLTNLVTARPLLTPIRDRVLSLDDRVLAVQDLVSAQMKWLPAA